MIKNRSSTSNATIADGSITNIKLADASITNIKIADGTISSAKLDASLNALISAGSVPEGSITSFHIANSSILTTDICNNAITFDKLAVDSVGNTRIINGAVTHAKLSSDCVQSHNILNGTILGTDISGYTITGSNIQLGTIEGIHLSSALTDEIYQSILNVSITSTNIVNGSILGSDICGNTITSANIQNGTILGTDISNSTISLANLDASLNTIINNSAKLQGVITIRNATSTNTSFGYTLYYITSGNATEFASLLGDGLPKGITASHYFVLPTPSSLIRVGISSVGGIGVETQNIAYGGELASEEGNEVDYNITGVNVLIEFEVQI